MNRFQTLRPSAARVYGEFSYALSATDDRKVAGELLGMALRKVRTEAGISHTRLSKMANVGRNKVAKAEAAGFLLDSERGAMLFSKISKGLGLEKEQISELLKSYLNHTEDNVHNQMRRARIASGMTIGELARQVNMKRWHLRVMELKEIKHGVKLENMVALELSDALEIDSLPLKDLLRPSLP